MNAKVGETTKLTVRNQNIDGVFINVYLKAALVNVTLDALTDFIQKEVSLKVTISRNNKNRELVSDNLEILGLYSSLNYGISNWYKGNVIVHKDVAVKEELLVTCFIPFGGAVNVKNDDILTIEVTAGRAVFSADIDGGVSFINFDYHNCIGYEKGLPFVRSQVVNANTPSDKYTFGDNVIKLAFLNLDKDNISENVVTSFNIDSIQWSQSLDFFTMLNMYWNCYVAPIINYRFGNTQPVTAGNEALPYLPKYPQSIILFSSGNMDSRPYLDNCSVAAQFVGSNVTAGKNYFVATSIEVTREAIEKAAAKAEQHGEMKLDKIPQTA